jgi:hypothetical protein
VASDAGRSTGATVAISAIIVGAIVTVAGIAGAAADWGSSSKAVVTVKPVSTIAPAAARPPESPLAFVARLNAAIKNHDAAFLYGRLHPAVIERYGETQCRTFVPQLNDRYATVGSGSQPAPYAYTSDGKTTEVPNVVSVPVRIIAPDGTVTSSTLHTAQVNGTYRYFVDCGTPVT